MKTQITKLINGARNVLRNSEDPKYLSANRATSHIGYAGSPASLREEVSKAVSAENGETINVMVKNIELVLSRRSSLRGKTVTYTCSLSEKQYYAITGFVLTKPWKNEQTYLFSLYPNMTCELRRIGRRNSVYNYIDESFVVIL